MVGMEIVAEWLTAYVENFLTYGPEGIEDDQAHGGLAEAGRFDGRAGLVLTHAAALAAGEHGSGGGAGES